ncbi:phytanoyl-CoA dioxygenase domain-containing protein 1 [Caerostris extrusa]|uniref:Phytanoyl-CoA dioxygenase domain-containing protein 1 n=1 Tax=Caerostris extrusa TaxID=172846 RepID=A0AAV4RWR7_CAEEX|nr:phytanoyl-CoA dioxygenase domain-containing protein 1 [Caerostris extrusa]
MDYQKYYKEYQENGCIKIENFLSPSEVDVMRKGLADALETMTDDVHVHSAYSDPKIKKAYCGKDTSSEQDCLCCSLENMEP